MNTYIEANIWYRYSEEQSEVYVLNKSIGNDVAQTLAKVYIYIYIIICLLRRLCVQYKLHHAQSVVSASVLHVVCATSCPINTYRLRQLCQPALQMHLVYMSYVMPDRFTLTTIYPACGASMRYVLRTQAHLQQLDRCPHIFISP